MAGLAPTFGRGAMTNHWVDIKNADLVLIMGGNAAEAHPCGFKWVTEAKAHNDARLIVVDPRFTRSASVADVYAPIRPGTDIAFLGGVIRYLLENDRIQREYVTQYTDAAFIVREEFAFGDGIYSGYDAERRAYDRSSWEYEIGEDGYARTDPTLAHPRCVLNLLGAHYARYTPEMVERICGTPRERFLQICEMIASTATPTRAMTIMYALGWTQHSVGSQMIRCGAMLQLLLGNIGVSGGGMNALRGHSNIQGLTDLGLLSDLLPGYLAVPTEDEQRYGDYVAARTQRPLRPNQLSYWQYYPRFFVSLQKAWWGDAARAENDWAYDYLPKLDRLYDMLQTYELMHQGRFNGYLAQGFNPLAAAPSKAKMTEALSRLKYLVIMDPLATETSEFWRNFGEHNDVDSSAIETEVFRLPTSCFAEEEGALVNSGRWLQWHWKGAEPPGDARTDIEIMSGLFTRLRRLYETEGGAFPDPILNLTWSYANPERPSPEEIAREYNGRALADVTEVTEVTQVTDVAGAPDGTDAADVADAPDATDAADAAVGAAPPRIVRRAGEQLSGFGELRDDGTTACGCWIYAGAWTEAGNQMARRDNSDPTGIGQTLNWAWSWPANRRVLYNRASCDSQGRPFDPARTLVEWNGTRWTGADTPDFPLDAEPGDGMGPFIMNQEGVARLFARGNLAEGPFPEHYEPFETPLGYNPLHPDELRAVNNPAARVFDADRQAFGDAERFPHVATTYRLTEHFHFWTQHVRLNAIIQPEQFVEIGEGLARELGIAAGDRVHVESNRGRITAVAVVTKRIRTLDIDGRQVHTVGIPITWGFTGVAKPGFLANTLTPFVGDANVQTPEFKAFLVRVEKA